MNFGGFIPVAHDNHAIFFYAVLVVSGRLLIFRSGFVLLCIAIFGVKIRDRKLIDKMQLM